MDTREQRIADEIDLDLDRLARRALAIEEDAGRAGDKKTAAAWRRARFAIDGARPPVRDLMSEKTREETRG